MSLQVISTLNSRAEFNEIYNHYHAGNYLGTIQLVERYAPRESSSEIIRAVYQVYRLFSLYALSQFSKLMEESSRLSEVSSDARLKSLFGYFKSLCSSANMATNSPAIKNFALTENSEEEIIIRHFNELIYTSLLIKEGKICQAIDLLSADTFISCGTQFHLERLAIVFYSALRIDQLQIASAALTEMRNTHIDSIPTLVCMLIFHLHLKNLSLWNIKTENDEVSPQSLRESLLAVQETIESYGGPSASPQLSNVCNIASYLLESADASFSGSDIHSSINSLWYLARNGVETTSSLLSNYSKIKPFSKLLEEKSLVIDRLASTLSK